MPTGLAHTTEGRAVLDSFSDSDRELLASTARKVVYEAAFLPGADPDERLYDAFEIVTTRELGWDNQKRLSLFLFYLEIGNLPIRERLRKMQLMMKSQGRRPVPMPVPTRYFTRLEVVTR